jgi:type II secretory pathway predicted ATPase ExeA
VSELKLKETMARLRVSNAELHKAVGISKTSMSLIATHGRWPNKRPDKVAALKAKIQDYLLGVGAEQGHGAQDELFAGLWEPVAAGTDGESGPGVAAPEPAVRPEAAGKSDEDILMLMAKQGLTQAARKHFGLRADPFDDDIQGPEDVYRSAEGRVVWERMLQTARHGGFLAVIGESGAGKSTLADDLEDALTSERQNVLMIRPYVLGMEGDERRGWRLKAAAILDAIIGTVAPGATRPSDPHRKAERTHQVLRESAQAGYRHCLVIDEAHRLAPATLKHLKGLYELRQGHTRLLSIVLLGQPELHQRLDERNPELREVTQRCELWELPALDNDLPAYLDFKLRRCGSGVEDVFEDGAIQAIRDKLTFRRQRRNGADAVSLVYPLAVGNQATAAMNLAAQMGAPRVTADIVREV